MVIIEAVMAIPVFLFVFASSAAVGWCFWTSFRRKLHPVLRAGLVLIFVIATLVSGFIWAMENGSPIKTDNDNAALAISSVFAGVVEIASYSLVWGVLRLSRMARSRMARKVPKANQSDDG
jgi:hypothetical protein